MSYGSHTLSQLLILFMPSVPFFREPRNKKAPGSLRCLRSQVLVGGGFAMGQRKKPAAGPLVAVFKRQAGPKEVAWNAYVQGSFTCLESFWGNSWTFCHLSGILAEITI